MVKIICRAVDCIFWEDGLCTSDEITYDPDEGCLTYEVIDDVLALEDEAWLDDDTLADDDDDDLETEELYEEEEEEEEFYDDDDLDLEDNER